MGRPTRKQVLARVDRCLDDLAAVGGLPLPQEAEGIWEKIWLEETHHSTAMEGNTLVLRQVKALLEEGRAIGNKDLREYLEIEGYGDAAKWVYANALRRDPDGPRGSLMTMDELREIHRLVMGPVWSRFADPDAKRTEGPGGFRECELQPLRPGLTGAPFVHIHAELSDWLAMVNAGQRNGEHLLYYVAHMHAAFERVHPFRDGNGRVGRLATNLLLVRGGTPPAIIDKTRRSHYLWALGRADDEDAGPLAEVLARAVRLSVERHMLPALAGPARLVPLASLETKALSRTALLSAAKRGRLRTVTISGSYYSNRRWVQQYESSRRQGRKATALVVVR